MSVMTAELFDKLKQKDQFLAGALVTYWYIM